MKKAQYFSVDAIFATVLMLIGLLLALSVHIKEPETASVEQYSQDVMNIISSVKLSELNNSYIMELYNTGVIDDLNKTLLEQAAFFWAGNQTDIATNLLNITQELIPAHISLGIFLGNELVFGKGYAGQPTTLISSKRLISGIEKGKPVEGFSSIVQLASFEWRSSYSYYYFGGFVGQGNLTVPIIIPNDVVNVTSGYVELDVNNNFTLYINGNASGFYETGSGGGSYMHADKWDILPAYLVNFINGTNYVSFNFSNPSTYVGGGFIRIGYSTSEVNETAVVFTGNDAIQKYYFPEINGLPNLYDSFFVPGQLQTMTAHIHYTSDLAAFLTIGNTTVWSYQGGGEHFSDLSGNYLQSMLSFSDLSEKTIPLRFGIISSNATGPSSGKGNADIVLVNDYSGSMEYCATSGCSTETLAKPGLCGDNNANHKPENGTYCNWKEENYTLPNEGLICSQRWHAICPIGDMRKIDISKNASKAFADILLVNDSSSRLGIVGYSSPSTDSDKPEAPLVYRGGSTIDIFTDPDGIVAYKNLTNSISAINSHIDANMDTYWESCICCGVRKARQMLASLSNSSRYKVLILMSDGIGTDTCGPAHGSEGPAENSAIIEAHDACDNYNISVSTVAYGTDVNSQTLKNMVCNNGSFYNVTNLYELLDAYKDIADQIKSVTYSEQTIINVTSETGEGKLFGDSYIEYNYTPNVNTFGMIPAILETPRFGNNLSDYTFNLVAGKTLSEARITSYSAEKWTDTLTISNGVPNRKAFSLKDWGDIYSSLGDPFVVYANPALFEVGNNLMHVSTGTANGTNSGGSSDNMMIYKVLIPNIAGESGVFPSAEGCTWWNLTFEDGTTAVIEIPAEYSGGDNCSYNPASYDLNDAIDSAVYELFSRLDMDGDGLLDVKFTAESIDVKSFTITKVPSLWGPALAEVRAWQ